MKVTALIDDKLIDEVRNVSQGKNITESLVIALTDWLRMKKLQELNLRLEERAVMFHDNFSAQQIRDLNRKP